MEKCDKVLSKDDVKDWEKVDASEKSHKVRWF